MYSVEFSATCVKKMSYDGGRTPTLLLFCFAYHPIRHFHDPTGRTHERVGSLCVWQRTAPSRQDVLLHRGALSCGRAWSPDRTLPTSGWLFTNVCRTYATTDVVPAIRLIHDECRKSMTGRTPDRTCATLRWPVSAIT